MMHIAYIDEQTRDIKPDIIDMLYFSFFISQLHAISTWSEPFGNQQCILCTTYGTTIT